MSRGRPLGARDVRHPRRSGDAVDKIEPVLAAVDEAKAAHPELFIGAFGDGERRQGDQRGVGKDLERPASSRCRSRSSS